MGARIVFDTVSVDVSELSTPSTSTVSRTRDEQFRSMLVRLFAVSGLS